MPDLHEDAIHAFWDSYDRRTLYRVIVALEKVEYWAQDTNPELEQGVLELGRQIDKNGGLDVTGKEEVVVRFLAATKSGRAIRILQALDIAKPGTAAKLLSFAEEHQDSYDAIGGFAKLFLHRNLVFERMQLIARVFSSARLNIALKAIDEFQNN